MSEKTEITTEEFEAQRAALEAKLAECGERVRTLKAEGDTDAEVLAAAVTALRQAKDELKQAVSVAAARATRLRGRRWPPQPAR